jgi:hypothetical protein
LARRRIEAVRTFAAAALVLLSLALPASADAKDFHRLVVVGAAGRSLAADANDSVLESFFDAGSPFNRRAALRHVAPRGGYVLLYLLGPDGLPGIPGRFYPEVKAACFAWSQLPRPQAGDCSVPNATLLRLLAPARRLPLLTTQPTVATRVQRRGIAVVANVATALTMGFSRWHSARHTTRPRRCLDVRARWTGPSASTRPTSFCLAPRGAWSRGVLYPLGRGVWEIVFINA